jgi:glycine cleavage system transcriptional repressor
MAHFALSAIGRDRPGIVAAVTGALSRHGVNIEDSQMTILGGHFTMTLILAPSGDLDEASLRRDLDAAGERLELEELWVSPIEEGAAARVEPTHMLSVYGADHPGIVHAVSECLAEREVNITDLETRLVGGDDGSPLYVMMIEVALPAEMEIEELERALAAVGGEQSLDVTLRPLEQDVL